jgi:hypothetical protein
LRLGTLCAIGSCFDSVKFCLRFSDGEAGVIIGIGFLIRPEIGNTMNYSFGIVTAGKGSHCIGPITFGLALVSGNGVASGAVPDIPRRFGRVLRDIESAQRIDLVGCLHNLHDKFNGELSVREAG